MESYDRYYLRRISAGPCLSKLCWQLQEKFESIVANGPQEIDIVEWMRMTALELIGQAGLGYSFGTLEGRNDKFNQTLKEFACV